MKNITKLFVLAAAVVVSAGQTAMYPATTTSKVLVDKNFYYDGLRYKVTKTTTKTTNPATVTDVYTAAVYAQNATEHNYCNISGEVNVPEKIVFNGYEATVDSIYQESFAHNTTITKVTLPSTLTWIGHSVFSGMTALEDVRFAESQISILYEKLFKGCTSLKRVDFPACVEKWNPESAFTDCAALKSVTFPADSKLTTLYGSTSNNATKNGAFYGCTALRSFTFPASVNNIATHYMFEGSGVETVTFADNKDLPDMDTEKNRLKITGQYMFKDCASLKTVIFPTYIYYFAASATGSTVQSNMFVNCPELKNVVFPEDCTLGGIPTNFMNNCGVPTVKIPESVTWIGASAFKGCANLKGITLREGITSIGANAFENCTSLESLTLPGTLTTLPNTLCLGCTSLSNVVINPGPTTIGKGAFENCTSLRSIVIPEGVTGFKNGTSTAQIFYGCSALEYVVLPSTFAGAGYILTTGVTGLKAIVSRSTNPGNLSTTNLADAELYKTVTVYVPTEELIATYKAKSGWKNFENYAVSGLFGLPETATLYLNEKRSLDATTENKVDPLVEALGIIWKTSDPEAVSVDADGTLTANKITTTPVTVTGSYWGNPLTCAVSVVANPYRLTLYDMILNPGETKAINANLALNENATPGMTLPASPSIKWTVGNPAVAEVDENGVVKALALGQTTLTADYRGESRTVNVYVQPFGELEIAVGELTVRQGETLQLKPVLNTENEIVDIDPTAIKWNVTVDGGINAFVDANGKVFGAKPGMTTVTADYYGKTATCKVSVTEGTQPQERKYTLVVNMPQANGQVHLLNATDGTVVHFEADGDGHVNAVQHDEKEITHTLQNGRYTVNNPDKPTTTVTVKYDR